MKQAAHLAVSVSTPSALGASLSGQYSSEAQRTQAMAEIENITKTQGYHETLDSIGKAAKDIKFSESQYEDKNLAEDLTASCDQIQSLREANSVSEQNIQKYSNSTSYVESHGFLVDQTFNQKFLDWLSTRQEHGGTIGANTARKMIDRWGSDAQSYFETFKTKEVEMIVHKANIESKASIVKADYSQRNVLLKNNFDQVKQKAAKAGIEKSVVKNQHLKVEIENKLSNVDKRYPHTKVKTKC